MQGPQHPRFLRNALKLFVVLLALSALAGCREREEAENAAAKLQRRLDSSGKRVLVVDAERKPVAKLRERSNKYKVYDNNLEPVGFVSWEAAAKADGEGETMRVFARTFGQDDERPIEQVSEGNYEMGAKLRLERTDRGWAVFGPDAKLAGIFERVDEGGWRLRQSYEDGAIIEATKSDGGWTLTHDGTTILELQSGQLSAPELLALELEGLSVLHKVAVGAWMVHARPQTDS